MCSTDVSVPYEQLAREHLTSACWYTSDNNRQPRHDYAHAVVYALLAIADAIDGRR